MARHDDADRIAAIGQSHRARRGRRSDLIGDLTDTIDQAKQVLADLHTRRRAMLLAARQLDPTPTQQELADRCRVSGPAIIGQLRKAETEASATAL